MKLTSEISDGICRAEFVPSGAGDFGDGMHSQVAPVLADESVKGYLFDVSGIDYINSQGIGCMVEWHQTARKRGAMVVYLKPPGTVRDILALCQLDRVLKLCETEAEALALISGS